MSRNRSPERHRSSIFSGWKAGATKSRRRPWERFSPAGAQREEGGEGETEE